MYTKFVILFIATFFLMFSCKNTSNNESSEKQDKNIYSCIDSSINIKIGFKNVWEKTLTLPTKGQFVEESHYVTTSDKFTGKDFPSTKDENIITHLNRALDIYKKYDSTATFDYLYGNSWNREWTPEESGKFGQGSIGNIQLELLNPEYEVWLLTMMWKGSKPKPGTKFILSANNKSVVVVAGFETGPASEKYIGGVTCEVHRWLGTNSNSIIEIKYPKDQTLPVGPIDCKRK